MERLGVACAEGALRIAHEHLASAAVRSFLESFQGAYEVPETSPTVVVTTPSFQHHELAAIIVAAVARSEGWRATYLGSNLPAEEIAAATARPGVRVLALSVTLDPDDERLDEELRKIGRMVPEGVRIVVGGRASDGLRGALEEIGALQINDLAPFRDFLESSRARA
jgi:methylmalonyl-CoA mutase cobalamin-binding subunit